MHLLAFVVSAAAIRVSPTHSLLPAADPLPSHDEQEMNQKAPAGGMDALQRQLEKHALVLSHYMPPTTEKAAAGAAPARMPAGVRVENARPGAALQDDKMPVGTERPLKPSDAAMDASSAVRAVDVRLEAMTSRSTHDHAVALFEAPQREPQWAREGPAGGSPVRGVRNPPLAGVEI
jgi:hypothetical protein